MPIGYSDAYWAGDVGDIKSTSGYVYLHCWWTSIVEHKKQDTVALSLLKQSTNHYPVFHKSASGLEGELKIRIHIRRSYHPHGR